MSAHAGDSAVRRPDLAGQVALVTGGSRGIGRAIAAALGASGATVAINHSGRDEARADTAVREIVAAGGAARAFACDVGDERAVTDMVTQIAQMFGSPTILVNNAGIDKRGTILELNPATWRALFRTNVDGAFLCTRAVSGSMAQRGWGRIITITSVAAHLGWKGRAAYAATKGALEAFTRAVAYDLGPYGVTVNAVAPGAIDTEIWAGQLTPSMAQVLKDRVPLRAIGMPRDVAAAVAFLASPEAGFITGATLHVDGGRANCDYLPPENAGPPRPTERSK